MEKIKPSMDSIILENVGYILDDTKKERTKNE